MLFSRRIMPNPKVDSPIFSKCLRQGYLCLRLIYNITVSLMFGCKSPDTEKGDAETMAVKKKLTVSPAVTTFMPMMAQLNAW